MKYRRAATISMLLAMWGCGESDDESGRAGSGGNRADAASGGGTGAASGNGGSTGGSGAQPSGGTGGGAAGSGASASGGAAGAAPTELKPPIRAAFFYPWFPETWGNLADPFTNYEPAAGYYDSSAPSVIQTQLKQLRYGHIDAVIASWWGKGSKPDGRVATLLNESAALAAGDGGALIRFALYVEAEGDATPWGSVNPTVDQIKTDLEYIDANYASHSAFWKMNGKPVLFTWGDAGDDCTSPERWVAANDAFEAATGKRFFIVMKLFSGFASCPKQPDSWHQYGPATSYHEHLPYSAVVSPGFWLKGDAAPKLVRDPARFKDDVVKMNAANAMFKLITTFDEWGEGTAVEPAKEWQSPSGNGVYLDILHDQPQ